MANEEQLAILRQGVEVWNRWRKNHKAGIDLSDADLSGTDFSKANFSQAELAGVNFSGSKLIRANFHGSDFKGSLTRRIRNALFESSLDALSHVPIADVFAEEIKAAIKSKREPILPIANFLNADLREADLRRADLFGSILSGADLSKANLTRANLELVKLIEADLSVADLSGANLSRANLERASLFEASLFEANFSKAYLSGADLTRADLRNSNMVGANIENARISGSYVYGISVWDLEGEFKEQKDLIITPRHHPPITVDNIKVAQFVYLILNNKEVRDVLDTVTTKAVLILGRFYEERKYVLDALKDALRKRDFVPILFDFEPSKQRDLTETIQLLANMAKFVIADLTDAKSIPQELSHIIPLLPSVPVQPILLVTEQEYAMFEHWRSFKTVLPEFLYRDKQDLLDNLEVKILQPIDAWRKDQDEISVLKERIKELEAKKS